MTSAHEGGTADPSHCQNCNLPLTGAFCSGCGQRAHSRIISLGHLLQEAVEDFWHVDSRLWLTLRALLLKPGFLTQEFLAGRRAHYLPPFRLYIVASILLFLLTSHFDGDKDWVIEDDPVSMQHALDATRAALLEKRAEFARDPTNERLREKVDELTTDLDELREAHSSDARPGSACDRVNMSLFGWAGLEAHARIACHKISADRGAGLERVFVANLPKSMFLFLPLLALANKILYLRSRRYYVVHLLFFVHLHVFLFLALSAILIGNALFALVPGGVHPPKFISFAVAVWLLLYVYWSLRRVYGQGRFKTLIKFGILGCAYTICLLLTTTVTLLYSAFTL